MSTTTKPAAVRREEILVGEEYERARHELRAAVLEAKVPRRIHLGEHLTLLFENSLTVRYQVQEMLRIEKRTSEEDVAHELATYNELLGGPGELGCTLLIEIDDPRERDRLLREWLELPRHLHLELADGSRAPARFDERQVGSDRLSSVQYLCFACGASPPVAVVCDLPGLELRAELTPAQREALAADLAASRG